MPKATKTAVASRFITRVELTPQSREKLTAMTNANGMTQVALLSRVLDWFSGQSEVIQAIVLGRLPAEIAPEAATIILRKLAEEGLDKPAKKEN